MIKVVTHSGTEYIIDEANKKIKRIPRKGTELSSVLRGLINVGEFQQYTSLDGLEINSSLHVIYPNEQNWSYSTLIKEIDYGFKEDSEEASND